MLNKSSTSGSSSSEEPPKKEAQYQCHELGKKVTLDGSCYRQAINKSILLTFQLTTKAILTSRGSR